LEIAENFGVEIARRLHRRVPERIGDDLQRYAGRGTDVASPLGRGETRPGCGATGVPLRLRPKRNPSRLVYDSSIFFRAPTRNGSNVRANSARGGSGSCARDRTSANAGDGDGATAPASVPRGARAVWPP
jgi:hypothetical protein